MNILNTPAALLSQEQTSSGTSHFVQKAFQLLEVTPNQLRIPATQTSSPGFPTGKSSKSGNPNSSRKNCSPSSSDTETSTVSSGKYPHVNAAQHVRISEGQERTHQNDIFPSTLSPRQGRPAGSGRSKGKKIEKRSTLETTENKL